MHGITNSGGQPTLPDASGTFLSNQGLEARQQTLELGGVDLHVAFDDVQRTNQGVGETTAQYAGNHALEVVGVVVGNSGILEARIPFSRWLRGHCKILLFQTSTTFFEGEVLPYTKRLLRRTKQGISTPFSLGLPSELFIPRNVTVGKKFTFRSIPRKANT